MQEQRAISRPIATAFVCCLWLVSQFGAVMASAQNAASSTIRVASPDAAVLEWRERPIHVFKIDEKTGALSDVGTVAPKDVAVPAKIYRYNPNNYVELDIDGKRQWVSPEAIRKQKPERLATCAQHPGGQTTGAARFGSEGC